jgi:hypothetical protein
MDISYGRHGSLIVVGCEGTFGFLVSVWVIEGWLSSFWDVPLELSFDILQHPQRSVSAEPKARLMQRISHV